MRRDQERAAGACIDNYKHGLSVRKWTFACFEWWQCRSCGKTYPVNVADVAEWCPHDKFYQEVDGKSVFIGIARSPVIFEPAETRSE